MAARQSHRNEHDDNVIKDCLIVKLWSSKAVGTNHSRTPNDALRRVACIMLDGDIRGGVHGMLCSRRDRNKQDQSISTDQGLYEVCAAKFNDPNYEARVPDEAYKIDNYEAMSPNDLVRISIERDWSWFQATWEEYLRRKYREALKRWNKQTGGGDGTSASFQNYCGGDRWLAFVFMSDEESNFLLASNASGKVPVHLQNESGFGEGGDGVATAPRSSTKSTLEGALVDWQEKSTSIYASIETAVASLGAQIGGKRELSEPEADGNIDHKSIHGIMDEIQKLRAHESLIESEESYTPMTKEAMSEGVKKRKVELGKMAKTLFLEK
jgi:hypothetical protein